MPWTDDYLTIPYKDGGRSRDGADCFGLYAIVLADRAKHSLPDYSEHWGGGPENILARMEEELMTGRWLKVDVPAELDCVRMNGHAKGPDGKVRRAPVHLGCVVGTDMVLHVEDVRGPRILKMTDPAICRRIVGIYRPMFLRQS